jgi:tetratricopeptide (TPR) repeat protein
MGCEVGFTPHGLQAAGAVAKAFGDLLWNSNRLDEAAIQLHRSIELDPPRSNTRVDLADVYFDLNRYPEAFAEYQKAEEISGGAGFVRVFQAIAYHRMGQDAEVEEILQKMKEYDRLHPRQDTYLIAVVTALLGKNDEAMHWLETACQYHAPGYEQFVDEDAFQPLHPDPRYRALSKRMKLSPANGTSH